MPILMGRCQGSTSTRPLPGVAATPDGRGYWLVAADGGIFAFGDARYYGSLGARPSQPAHRRHASTPTAGGTGWWPPTEASSPLGTPVFMGRWGPGTSTRRSWASRPPVTAAATGWWPPTEAFSPSGTPLLRVDGFQAPQPADSRVWRRRPTAAATGWWRPTAAFSGSAMPAFSGRWAGGRAHIKVVGIAV